MKLLQKHKTGDPAKYSSVSELIAKRLEAAHNWNEAREYWQLKVFWEKRLNHIESARNTELLIANTYIKQAETLIKGSSPSYLGAMSWFAKAVQTLRQAKADKTLIDETHQKLLDCQRQSVKEFTPFRISYDDIPGMRESLEQAVEASVGHVKGLGLHEALTRFISVAKNSNPDEIKERIKDTNKTSILSLFVTGITVRKDGQVSDLKPSMISDDPKQRESALTKEMYSQAVQVDWRLAVGFAILPALEVLQSEHAFRIADLEYIVQNNPFVPPGREGLYLRGLHAGFHGDYTLAIHLLIPQLENSLRHYFTALGIITSKLESDQTQDEHDLGWLLCHPKMTEMFTSGMSFDLRGLLVERFGFNLRNEVAHGFLDDEQFNSIGPIFIWWLILRLCYIPVIHAKNESELQPPTEKEKK